MDKINIAIIQLKISLGNKDKNFKKVKKLASSLPNNIDIICLPELFSTGYALKSASKLAESTNGPTIDFLSNIAVSTQANLIGGSFIEESNDKLFNSSPILNRSGELIGIYRKTHLFSLMKEIDYFDSGSDLKIFDLDIGPIGVLICYDLRFPEASRSLTTQGAKIIFYPSHFPNPRYLHWLTLISARAIENQLFTVGINRIGHDQSNTYFGHSLIADPWGKIVFEASEEENAFLVEINLREIDKVRSFLPSLKDRRPDIYND